MNVPFPHAIRADRDFIHFNGSGNVEGNLLWLEPWETGAGTAVDADTWVRTANGFKIPRREGSRDRLYGRFLVRDPWGRTSKPQWVTDVEPDHAVTARIPIPNSRKGITCPVDVDDVIALGTRWVNTNVNLRDALDLDNPAPEQWIDIDGERFGIRSSYFEALDRTIKRLTDAGIHVVVVLNNPVPRRPDPGDPFVHPGTDLAAAPNRLGAFALHNRRSFRAYRAVLEAFAARYSRPDRRYGWIGGYIVGNEIQQHWEWYNRGLVEAEAFLAEYAVALRTTWLALRRHHPDLRAYVSMDHHWTATMKGDPRKEIPGRTVLETLNRLSKNEGDFDWHVAFHPYPENLFEPRFWRDRQAPVAFDAPKITFKNLEVLPAWLDKPQNRVRGKARRVILSEQGFHAADSPEGETLQAAALAAATVRVDRIPGIDSFMLHRHVSHRNEGGLRLGLWSWDPKSPDPSAPGRKFPSWDVFQAAGTVRWEETVRFALPIVGIRDWRELNPTRKILEKTPLPKPDPGVVLDLVLTHAQTRRSDCADWRVVGVSINGREMDGIFQHPPAKGIAVARYLLALPTGKRCVLRFLTGFLAASANGAEFSIRVDDEVVWSTVQTVAAFVPATVDLARWRGRTVELALCVDGRGDITNDWCVWAGAAVRVAAG